MMGGSPLKYSMPAVRRSMSSCLDASPPSLCRGAVQNAQCSRAAACFKSLTLMITLGKKHVLLKLGEPYIKD